tara:strand:+ start:167 stop:580 length:414 start_codon:yes stop_codon:yes gene_type:complete
MAERDTRFGGNLETANTRPRVSNEVWHRMSNQPRLDSMNSGLFSERINDSSVNEMRNNYMQFADYSPDFRGRWMTQSPTGNKFLSYLVNQFGSEGSSEYLEDILGTGGISAFGGTFSPNFERRDDGWSLGFTGKWNL